MANVIKNINIGTGDERVIRQIVTSNDRGPQGDQGVSVTNVAADANGDLITTLSDGTTINGGELPMALSQRIYVGEMNGTQATYNLPDTIDETKVAYILINGVIYTSDYSITSTTVTIELDELPTGKLEVVLNDTGLVSTGNDVTKQYVDQQDQATLTAAKNYTDQQTPKYTSELTNDSGYQTQSDVANAVNAEKVLREAADADLQEQINNLDPSGGGPTVVQTTGSSTTDVMSQNAVTKMFYSGNNTIIAPDANAIGSVTIGRNDTTGYGNYFNVGIGNGANAFTPGSVSLGYNAINYHGGEYGTALGYLSAVAGSALHSVALGATARATRTGEVNVGSYGYNYGYNNSAYRVIGGVYDGQELHDAATVAQGNTLATSTPTTSTAGALGQLYTDTTSMHTYQCTAIDLTDPNSPAYTWTQRW